MARCTFLKFDLLISDISLLQINKHPIAVTQYSSTKIYRTADCQQGLSENHWQPYNIDIMYIDIMYYDIIYSKEIVELRNGL